MMRAWDEYLKALEKELGTETINKWLRSLKILNFDAANLYLEAADSFQAQWFNEYILPKASRHFCNENNRPIKVHLQIAHKREHLLNKNEEKESATSELFIKDPIDGAYSFESLVQLSQNKIVYRLFIDFKSFDIKSTPNYNPIYIFGSEGIGKTHLLQATYSALKKQDIKTLYVKLPTFTQNMVTAIKTGKMADFRKFYRNCDILIIDDIHHLAHKTTTQEELFHTFNALHIEGKQIILSSNLSPGELKNIEPRLISRFEWGIAMPLKGPTPHQLKKILSKKCEEVQFLLSPIAKDFLVQKFSKSPQTLTRALSALILRAHLKLPQGQLINGYELTPGAIENLLSDLIKQEIKSAITVDHIIDLIAKYFGVQIEDILGKSQSREIVLPRQISMFFCREHLKLPYMKIGRIFSRDHSTVMSSVKQIQKNLLQKEQDASHAILALKQRIFPDYP